MKRERLGENNKNPNSDTVQKKKSRKEIIKEKGRE